MQKTNKEMQTEVWAKARQATLDAVAAKTPHLLAKATVAFDNMSPAEAEKIRRSAQNSAQECFNFVSYGQHDSSWLWFYKYFSEVCNVEGVKERLEGLWKVAETCGWWWAEKDLCIVTSKPIELHRDEQHRLHNETGPAIRYPSDEMCPEGWTFWAIHGVRVTEQIVMHPETLTPAQILAEQNVEVRRVMLERFGDENFIAQSGMKCAGQDDFGEVYIQEFDHDEPLVMVKVVNSTPEPDGSFRDYYLRVDPNAYNGEARRVPRAAVASTWRYPGGAMVFPDYRDYSPAVET